MTTITSNQVESIALALKEACEQVNNVEFIERYYDDAVESVEAIDMKGTGRSTIGKQAILEKNRDFFNTHDIHTIELSQPLVGATHFAVRMDYDVSNKLTGQRFHNMSELAVYEVKHGKIIREEFFYRSGECC